ncbi:MAG: deoxyribodipyrimidine photo-lyase [Bacteroidia bacterium]|nr:deoxyribodipyrimidine photo-lyase [Bacteroidia bacterium]
MSYTVFWFRRDLRLDDNVGLYHALRRGQPVLPVFIFDRDILDTLPAQDARVDFIHRTLHEMQATLAGLGTSLIVRYGHPAEVWRSLLDTYPISAVYTNHDYEPYAQARDHEISDLLAAHGAVLHTFRDQVIFERDELLSGAGKAYSVFTPYARKWRETLATQPERLSSFDTRAWFGNWAPLAVQPIPTLAEMGFRATDTLFPSRDPDEAIIRHYSERRDFPAQAGTTRIGLHLRFGTVSIRHLARVAQALDATYLNELIWREFYMQVLWNFPHVVTGPFRREYAAVPWLDDEATFEKWKTGRTGYPIVDAGMRELSATGYMHNRVRMITASFLSKHLLLNWQWGEAWFAEKLLDFELASNSGGWQWAAGCGTDAAPYFRIFNPTAQTQKFDAEMKYVRRWVPEYGTPAYPRPVVDHAFARERCLAAYKGVLGNKEG